MRARRFLFPDAVAALAVTLVAVGCGGTGSNEPVATTRISMAKSYVFEPKVVQVQQGATVTWTNDDNFTHTVQVDGQEDHEVEPGGSVALSFAVAGAYHYVCTLHRQDMDGEVLVG